MGSNLKKNDDLSNNLFFGDLQNDGCKAFGSGATIIRLNRWFKIWRNSGSNINSFLILAGSKTAEIEGVSAAGATKQSRRITAVADAELLLKGPFVKRFWQLPELSSGVSPALISHVAACLVGIKTSIIRAGILQTPSFPYIDFDTFSNGPSNCITTGKAMDLKRVETLLEKGKALGLSLDKPMLLTECVPGGTTTALAALTGLGISADKLVSSSNRRPPTNLKKNLVNQGLASLNLDKSFTPIDLLAAVGDPFQPAAVGLLLGARTAGQPVLLGGGSQMVAVLATALAIIDPNLREEFLIDIAIGTTGWLADEIIGPMNGKSAFESLIKTIEDSFDVSLLALSSGLHFYRSSKKVLRDYELGFIKEGVGAGAFALLAQLNGFSRENLTENCEYAVDQLI